MSTIVSQNFAAIVGLVGVVLGGVIGFLSGYLERSWSLADRRRQWRLEHLEEKLVNPIRAYVDEVTTCPWLDYWELADRAGGSPVTPDGNRYVILRERAATIRPRVLALRDERLSELFSQLERLFGLCRSAIGEQDLRESYDLVAALQETAGEMHARFEEILETTFGE